MLWLAEKDPPGGGGALVAAMAFCSNWEWAGEEPLQRTPAVEPLAVT